MLVRMGMRRPATMLGFMSVRPSRVLDVVKRVFRVNQRIIHAFKNKKVNTIINGASIQVAWMLETRGWMARARR